MSKWKQAVLLVFSGLCLFASGKDEAETSLSDEDKSILDIVIEKLGKMSKNEIIFLCIMSRHMSRLRQGM